MFKSDTDRSKPDRQPGVFHSRMLERYEQFLSRCEKPEVLDAGPVCGANIAFFLGLVSRLHVSDIMCRPGRGAPPLGAPEQLLGHFDYRPESLDGIHLWDIPDHLEDAVLGEVVRRCSALLKPNGLLMMIASNSSLPQPHPRFLAVGGGHSAELRSVPGMTLPYYYRSNRDIEIAMKPLASHCSFVCMNGIREFLFRRQ